MTYGNRLNQALAHAKKTRGQLAEAIGLSVQSVGQVIKGDTRAFTAENNAYTAKFLRVSSYWLATGKGDMTAKDDSSDYFTANARELATVFDMIPESDTLRRAKAYTLAMQALVDAVQPPPSNVQLLQDQRTQSA